MNVLLEGLYRVVLKINEEKVENNHVPIILGLDKQIIGLKNYQEDKTNYTPDDIIIKNPQTVTLYDKSIAGNIVSKFKNFGN